MKPSKLIPIIFVLLALLILAACSQDSAPEPAQEQDAASQEPIVEEEIINIEGNYNVLGANPDGSGYGCMLDVTANGEVYNWHWFACGEFDGLGIPSGNVVSVAWGTSDCHVAAYHVNEDGSLTYLPDKDIPLTSHVNSISFFPPRQTINCATRQVWEMYE